MKYKNGIVCGWCFLFGFANFSLTAKETADYIVIGVGTAGATISKLLSDDPNTSVLAIHNGKNLNSDPDIALSRNGIFAVISTLTGADFSQVGLTTPQPSVNNRELPWAIAVPEGGASSINAGAWAGGSNELYSQWEPIAGPEWSTTQINSIYVALENYHGETQDPAARGFNGPVDVRQIPATAFATKFTQAEIAATGVSLVIDYNDPNATIGISPQMQVTQSGPKWRIQGKQRHRLFE